VLLRHPAAQRRLVHPELSGDLRDRPAGVDHQRRSVTFELVSEPTTVSLLVLSHSDILSSEVSGFRGEVHSQQQSVVPEVPTSH